jgi:hypothetical protein
MRIFGLHILTNAQLYKLCNEASDDGAKYRFFKWPYEIPKNALPKWIHPDRERRKS